MNIVYQSGAPLIRGYTQQEGFSYTVRERPSGGSSTPSVQTDSNINTITGSDNNFALDVQDSPLLPGHSFVNNTPAIVSVDAVGNVNRLQNGAASIDIVTPVGRRNYTRNMTTSGSSKAWQSFVNGSLGKNIVDNMLALINGKTPGTATMARWSGTPNYSTAGPSMTPNANLWCGSLDLTPIGVTNGLQAQNDNLNYGHPPLLISARHLIGANHFPTQGPVWFRSAAGNYYSANITSSQQIGSTDIRVFYLDAAINAAITPFRVLPANWRTYLPNAKYNLTLNLPAVVHCVHGWAGGNNDEFQVNHFYCLSDDSSGSPNKQWFAFPRQDSNMPALATEAWARNAAGGDSGSPLILPVTVGGTTYPALIGAYFGAYSGQFYSEYITEIEAAMTALAGSAYTLTKLDLSAFTAY